MRKKERLQNVIAQLSKMTGVLGAGVTRCGKVRVFLTTLDIDIPEEIDGIKIVKRCDDLVKQYAKRKGII